MLKIKQAPERANNNIDNEVAISNVGPTFNASIANKIAPSTATIPAIASAGRSAFVIDAPVLLKITQALERAKTNSDKAVALTIEFSALISASLLITNAKAATTRVITPKVTITFSNDPF